MQTQQERGHWSNYWQSGSLTSLPQDFSALYDGEIGQFWEQHFAKLEAGSAVLDLCCGNGAIALAAAEYSRSNSLALDITAMDAAMPNTGAIIGRYPDKKDDVEVVKWLGNCPVEKNPLGSESQDLVCSQYGIEYTNWKQSASEVARLLKPGGSAVFVCHSPETQMWQIMKKEKQDYLFLRKNGLFMVFTNWLESRMTSQQAIKKLARLLKLIGREKPSPVLEGVARMLANVVQGGEMLMDQNKLQLANFHHQHLTAFQRLQDMLNVVDRVRKQPDWYRIFCDSGLQLIEQGEIYYMKTQRAGDYYCFIKE